MSTELSRSEDPIFAYRQAFLKAFKAGDVDGLVSLAADNIVCMSPNDTTVYGKDEYRAWWEEYYQYFRVAAINEPERSVIVKGDFATEYSAYMLAIVPVSGGSRIRDDGRTLAIWKRQPDGEWKVWQMMWNSMKPIGSGTNRYMSRLMQKKSRPQR
jgi:ketosteroid isomerase-like protein